MMLCVHIPEFPAQALLRLRPELARSPVAVLAGDPPHETVASINRRALRLGVEHGMTKTELDSFPNLTILRRSATEERSASLALLHAAGAFTPRVERQAGTGASWAMVLDMTGTDRLSGPISEAIQGIARSIRALRLSAHLAASANHHTAVSIAPMARRSPIVVPPGQEAHYLAPLPIGVLALTPPQMEAFALWGISTLGELAALPEVDLIVRLGQTGKRLRLLARGEHSHHMTPEELPFALEEFVELDAPVDVLESLLFVVSPMLGQLIARAQNHTLALASVTVRLGLDGGSEHIRTLKPALPVSDRDLLLKLLHLDLQAHPPQAGVLTIALSAEPGACSRVQLGLFSPHLPEPMRLDITLARIAALVGEDRVGRARLLDTHKPESFRMERFLVPAKPRLHEPRATPTIALRRCRPPAALAMRSEGERLRTFSLRGVLYTVEKAYGPWRRSGDWWSSEIWSAEEWDIEARSNEVTMLCLISHDLLRHQWQLEALYD